MKNMIDIILNGIFVIIIYTFLIGYFGYRKTARLKIVSTITAMLLSMVILSMYNGIPYEIASDILITLVAAGFCVAMLDGQTYEMLFICCFMLSVNVFNTIMTTLIFSVMRGREPHAAVFNVDDMHAIAVLVAQVVLFLIMRLMIRFKLRAELVFKEFSILLIFPVISVVLMSLLINRRPENINMMTVYMITMLLITMMNVVTYFLFMIISRRNMLNENYRMLKMQNESEKQRIRDIELMYNEIKGMRHDIKNHASCIASMAREERSSDIVNYVENYVQNAEYMRWYFVFTDNGVLDAIINTKFTLAAKKNIRCRAELNKCVRLPLQDVEITMLFGNIMDNAIEAAEKSREKTVDLRIVEVGDMVHITVTNSIEEPVLAINPELKTTKHDDGIHGIGIENIKRVAARYDGILEFSETKNNFRCDVIMPCS